MKDGKLLDEMAVSMTGLATKVGLAVICHAVQMQNLSSEQGGKKSSHPTHLVLLTTAASADMQRLQMLPPPPSFLMLKKTGFAVMLNFYLMLMQCNLSFSLLPLSILW